MPTLIPDWLFRDMAIMRNAMDKVYVIWLLILFWAVATDATNSETKALEPQSSDRNGRSWHHSLFGGGPQMLLPQQHQVLPAAASTSQPSDTSTGHQPDATGSNRNFEDPHDKALPAASEMDYMSRQFGYLNVHRFDPNFPNYYDRQVYPRFPSPQAPRFGPGYRKDKYGHGYGYSCKQGDDCDEVRAANQLAARHPAPQQHPMMTFNNHYPDLPPFPSMPSPFSSLIPSSFSPQQPYGGHFGPGAPARFNDPYAGVPNSMSSMVPPRFYHARYLHDQDENRVVDQQQADDSMTPRHAERPTQ